MSKVPDQVLLPFKERMADRLDFDVAGLSATWARGVAGRDRRLQHVGGCR
jgi:hypothetical protein